MTLPIQFLSDLEKTSLYSRFRNDFFNMEAIFSDGTHNFVTPSEPMAGDQISITLRAAKDNVDEVYIHIDGMVMEMEKAETVGLFDFYKASMPVGYEKLRYYFSLQKNGRTYYYNKRGLFYDVDENFNFMIIPNFKIPAWAKTAVFYQIYVDRFYNGDKSNDVANNEYVYLGHAAKLIDNWEQEVVPNDIAHFYGGDLQGVMDKMTYLKELGVDVIYLSPLFVSPSNHKYDIQDYDYIDPHYGVIVDDGGSSLKFEKFNNRYATMYMCRTTNKANLEASNQLLISLIELAHQNGMRVILDGVFNHCGAFNKWLDKESFYFNNGYLPGAYRDENSVYHDYFRWYDKNWPNNDCYDAWWGHDNHPKLNYEASPELMRYMFDVAKKWVSPPFNADGWRLDVAADLGYSREFNHSFWREFRRVVKEANPEAIILAEHYGDPIDWIQGDQWDTVMNYDAFMEPITWFLTGMEKHSEEFRADMLCNAAAFESAMRYFMARFSNQSLQIAMNELSNHDHSRFFTRTNKTAGRLHTKGSQAAGEGVNKSVMMEAVAFQFTWPGAPTVYYGDEAGLVGWTDPDNRRTYPWGREDLGTLAFHREMIRIYKRYSALQSGSVEFLYLDYGILSYGRWDAYSRVAVVMNNNNGPRDLNVPVWKIGTALQGKMRKLVSTAENGFNTVEEHYRIKDGFLYLTLPPYSCIVLVEEE